MNEANTSIVVLPGYMPDGPGWRGDVAFELGPQGLRSGRFFAQILRASDGSVSRTELESSWSIPSVVSSFPVEHEADLKAIMERLSEPMRDAVDGSAADPSRMCLLEFSDGSRGAIVLGGESCYFSVIMKRATLDFAEGVMVEEKVFDSFFEIPSSAAESRPRQR